MALQLRDQDPRSPVSFKISATALVNQGDSAGALKEVEAGLKVAPQDENLLEFQKLLAKKVSGDPAPGMKKAFSVLEGADPLSGRGRKAASPADGVRLAAAFPISLSGAGSASSPDVMREGLGRLSLGDPAAAERQLTRQIQKDPRDWFAFRSRGMARYKRKDFSGALADAARALELNGRDAWAVKVQALALIELGRYAEAEAAIKRALDLNSYDADAYSARAKLREKQGRFEEMLADLKRAAELDPVFEKLYRQALDEHPAPASPSRGAGKGRVWAGLGLLLALVPLAMFLKDGAHDPMFAPGGSRQSLGPILASGFQADRQNSSIGGYNIVRKLGQGGMGVVFEAFDSALQRTVALKKMREEISGNRREAARFLKEAKTVASLNHPNIVRIYSVIERADGLYLVFEYVPGETLDQVLGRRKTLPVSDALPLLSQVAQGLDYAHGRGVVHRDLKPSNIMIAEDGTAKVMDFGIARQVQESLSRLSRDEVVGTPAYMAPEQELGECHKGSDLFALGVCFYEMLTGEVPFAGSHPVEQKLRGIFRPLREAAPGLPAALDPVMARALEPAREKRFSSANEFVRALRRALGSA